ncbi:serine hydrolase [Sphingomonas sp. DG1-23]|uniref:serine hydrolase n=1 Tax=Sphingomonas sp. DG1-23 TaxID=3068316 RepID=UPI00273D077E|nr:serine hydrolase [Sphingomonas sp. DG1-23]
MTGGLFPPLLLALASPLAAHPQQTPSSAAQASPALRARIEALVPLLSGTGSYESFFAPGLQTEVPKPKFDAIAAQLVAANGPVQRLGSVVAENAHSALVRVDYRDATVSFQIAVEPDAPHRVSTLVIRDVGAPETTLADATAALERLHGATGFALARLGSGTPAILDGHRADTPFAIGSAFKLIVLAELVRATNAGERKWDDLVTLDGSVLPGGGYNLRPKGTQVSLRELATQMISISDNSATDVLLKTLGRAKVEAMLPVVGVADPARNRPFLSTMELFKLKGIDANDLAGRYLAADEAGRRRMLDGEVADLPALLIRPTLFRDGKPVRIEQIEWFLSPMDLVRVMDWLRRNTEGPKGADARAVLSRNPGIAPGAAAKWQWVGYKGGSETGVINMTLLLRAKDGTWYVLTGSWNDPARAVEETRFITLISRAAERAAP